MDLGNELRYVSSPVVDGVKSSVDPDALRFLTFSFCYEPLDQEVR